MARRKKENIVDVLFDVSAMLPWWVSLIIAIVSYAVCHAYATAEITPAKNMAQYAPAIQQTIIKALATLAQYVLPIIFLAGAAASAISRAKRKGDTPGKKESFSRNAARQASQSSADAGNVIPDPHETDIYPIWRSDSSEIVPPIPVDTSRWSAELLSALEWKRFELVCAGLFDRLGFATRIATKGADGGVDIHLYRPPAEQAVAIVQCKAWTGNSKVGVRYIRELHGVMASMKVAEGIFATTATFSEDAKDYAKANHIDLMDGAAVLDSILALTGEQQAGLLQLATAGDYTTPTCPSCAVKMKKREPKGGGKAFWGCVNYPRCRTRIQIARA